MKYYCLVKIEDCEKRYLYDIRKRDVYSSKDIADAIKFTSLELAVMLREYIKERDNVSYDIAIIEVSETIYNPDESTKK